MQKQELYLSLFSAAVRNVMIKRNLVEERG